MRKYTEITQKKIKFDSYLTEKLVLTPSIGSVTIETSVTLPTIMLELMLKYKEFTDIHIYQDLVIKDIDDHFIYRLRHYKDEPIKKVDFI